MNTPIRRILVAVKEIRGRASPAIRKAAQIARACDAHVELFHAIAEPLAIYAMMYAAQDVQKIQDTTRARYLKRLETLAGPLRRTGLKVTTAVEWDYPAHEALVRRARQVRADLIVADQHPGRHAAPRFLRYTDWELIRHSPVPVLLVKTRGHYTAPRILAAVDPSHTFAKTARLDDAILRNGARFAAAVHGRLHVVHAFVPTLANMTPAEISAPDATARILGKAQAQAANLLDETLRAARLGKLAPGRRHLLARHPIDAIPQLARELRCDIVVMGALSRSGLKGLFIGNTAERLLDDLPCDLLVVKPLAFVTRIKAKTRGPQFVFLRPPGIL
jgi:universal stress protein E